MGWFLKWNVFPPRLGGVHSIGSWTQVHYLLLQAFSHSTGFSSMSNALHFHARTTPSRTSLSTRVYMQNKQPAHHPHDTVLPWCGSAILHERVRGLPTAPLPVRGIAHPGGLVAPRLLPAVRPSVQPRCQGVSPPSLVSMVARRETFIPPPDSTAKGHVPKPPRATLGVEQAHGTP